MRKTALLLSAFMLAGCFHVKNQLYNPATPAPPRPGDQSVVRVFTDHDTSDPNCDPSVNACLAFLEFDEMGEMWDPAQLDKAVALIQRAKKLSRPPIIVTFTHGWKNNADDRPHHVNSNVFGFEGVLDFLEHPPLPLPPNRFGGRPVVGIYIGWRGNLVSQNWPVRQQLTYFNREATAIRIPGASLTAALIRIMRETHSGAPGAYAVMVGHSFGGLIMERALSQAMADYILRGNTGQNGGDGAWADLVVFVNSAAAASEGKQMLDLLKQLHYKFAVTPAAAALERTNSPDLARTPDRPMFLSISSLGDTATRFLVPIGHGPSALARQITGSWRTYDRPDIPSVPSQRSYYLSTTAHMEVLQSHLIVENNPQSLRECGPLFSPTPVVITTGQQYMICRKNSWNDTPYWAMEMPATIVPDHSGIFNRNFIALLQKFLPSKDEMENFGLMPAFQ